MGYELESHGDYLIIKGISKGILDLDKTFDCGQCFRWKKLNNSTWQGVIRDKIYLLGHLDMDDTDGHTDGNDSKQLIITTATPEEWENGLYDYFDLNTDYSITIPSSDTFALRAMEFGKGIRILKQDPWESLISFIISQRNNIPRIKTTIDRLCKAYGNKITLEIKNHGEVREYIDYSFPTIETLAKLSLTDLSGIGLGYRDSYIISAAKEIESNRSVLYSLYECNSTETLAKLLEFKGVGKKVANCVALFGLHKLDMFPIDVWIQRVITDYYNGSIDVSNYGNLAGLIQQYMFYYIKNHR